MYVVFFAQRLHGTLIQCRYCDQGEDNEKSIADSVFHRLYKKYMRLINRTLPLVLFTTFAATVGSMSGYAVCAIPVFKTKELAGAPLTADSVLTAIGLLVTVASTMQSMLPLCLSLGGLAGYAHRVRSAWVCCFGMVGVREQLSDVRLRPATDWPSCGHAYRVECQVHGLPGGASNLGLSWWWAVLCWLDVSNTERRAAVP